MHEHFGEVFKKYLDQTGMTPAPLEKRTGIPRGTLRKWRKGMVKRPKRWQDIANVATALGLTIDEATHLLQSAGYPSISELHQQVTEVADRNLLATWPPVPFLVRSHTPHFVGREREISELTEALQNSQFVTLHGMGGAGKTSLAIHLAYQLRAEFPDGVLWADVNAMDTMTILSVFAGAYGKDVSSYRDTQSRSLIVRNLLANKRVLIILDDAQKSAQVRPLLPPTTGSPVVLITTRHDLVVADEMRRYPIRPFDPQTNASLRLLSSLLGRKRVQQNTLALENIADLLGHLPLALAILGGRLAFDKAASISQFLGQLHEADQALDVLIREDRSVRLSFTLSYQALSVDMQRFFAELGVFGGESFSLAAAAYVTETTQAEAEENLDLLFRLSLVQVERPGRFVLHSLLRIFAQEHISPLSAYNRMVTFYTELADALVAAETKELVVETSNILAALDTAFEHRMNSLLTRSTKAFHDHLIAQGLLDRQHLHLTRAIETAYRMESPVILAELLLRLGFLETEQGDFDKVEAHLHELLAIIDDLDTDKKNQELRCEGLRVLGVMHGWRGDRQESKRFYEESRRIALDIGYERVIVATANNLGNLASERGDYKIAQAYISEALARARKSNMDYGFIINLLHSMAQLYLGQEDAEQAILYLEEGEQLAYSHGQRLVLIGIFGARGRAARMIGNHAEVKAYWGKAMDIAREAGHLRSLCSILAEMGEISRQEGDYEQAQIYVDEALSITRQFNMIDRLCKSLKVQANVFMDQNRLQDAETTWLEMLQKAEDIKYQEHLIAGYDGLAQLANKRDDVEAATQYTQKWQAFLTGLEPYEIRSLRRKLPDVPI